MKLALLKITRIAAKCEARTDEIDEIQSIAEEAVWDADKAADLAVARDAYCAATCYEIRLNGKMIGTTFADRVEHRNDAIRLFHKGNMTLSLWLPVGHSYTGEQITVKEAA